MANMYPQNIAEYTPEDSERIVYQELKNQLPNTWDVFYSVPWTVYKRGQRIKSEADFIVCSPEYGFLCLEVKGGSQIRKENDIWYLSDAAHGERKLNGSPYDQAEKSMYYFESVFSDRYNLRYPGIYGAGVVFPFYAVPEELNLDNRQRFDQSSTKVDGSISKLGILHIPKRYRTAYIIDGQHRLYGYSDSKYAKTNTIPVVAFVDLDRTEQIKLFMDINENQKAVPKSLRVTLNADMLWESKDPNERRQALRSKIAQMLGEEPTSPLRSRVIVGEAETVPGRCITIEAIQAALKKCNFFNTYSKKGELISKGTFDLEDNQESCDLFYPFIEKCFLYIRENCLEEWNKGDKEDGMLTINRGIHGIIRVLDDLVNMLVEKGMIHPTNQDVEDMFVLLKYYLKPLTEYINALTTEQRKEIKKVFGGGGDVRFWRAYQKAIADVRIDFKPEGLEEYWLNEAKTFNDETRSMVGEIENKLKTIISDCLQEYFGTSWLVKGFPKNTYTKAKKLADEKTYDLQLNNDDDAEEVDIWDFVSLADCVSIVTNGKNWSSFFEEMLVRPEETKIAGGKEAKTQWILRLSAIKNKLSKESYSVPVDEYSYVKSIYDWIMEVLTL